MFQYFEYIQYYEWDLTRTWSSHKVQNVYLQKTKRRALIKAFDATKIVQEPQSTTLKTPSDPGN